MWYYTYIIKSLKNNKYYTGFTSDLKKRLREHNMGKKGSWTRGKGPYKILYFEACRHIEDALARELFLKSGMGKRYIHNRLKNFLIKDDESR